MAGLFLFHFWVTNSKLKDKKLHFELLTRWLNLLFFRFWATNSRLKTKKFSLNYWLEDCTFIFLLLSYEREVNIIAVPKWHGLPHSSMFFLYLVCFAVSIYVICTCVCWFLMAFASSTYYLLTRLPHAAQYSYNERQIELFRMKFEIWNLIVDRLTEPGLMSL